MRYPKLTLPKPQEAPTSGATPGRHTNVKPTNPTYIHPQDQCCFFSRLPAELRNRVYRELLPKGNVDVTPNGYERTDFLQTCKRIRLEFLEIYYRESKFLFDFEGVCKFEHVRKLVASADHPKCLPLRIDAGSLFEELEDGVPHWSNLIEWCRSTYEGKVEIEKLDFEMRDSYMLDWPYIVKLGMFKMVEELGDVPWPTIEAALKPQRFVLAQKDERWLED